MKKIPLRLLLCSILLSLLFTNQTNAQNQGQFQPQVLPGVPNPPGPITGPTSANNNGNSDIVIDTTDIPNGRYYLHILKGKDKIEKQIIIQH